MPGACLGVLVDGEAHELAVGVLDLVTGAPMATDVLFQIASLTKPFTATLVMQLVGHGLLSLDTPVLDVLPELRLADPRAARQITVRHLLGHTSGIEGGFFPDTGGGDDCLDRYVTACAGLGQCHPVGATVSYCHSGYVLIGRIVERVTGQVWDSALRERLLDPLGLRHTVTLPAQTRGLRLSPGHAGDFDAPYVWRLEPPRSAGPGGGIRTTVADLLAFAHAHLHDGAGIMPCALAAAMRAPYAKVPDHWTAEHRGLGWLRYGWGGREVYGHAGHGPGQYAFLYLVQDRRLAIALLTNGGDSLALRTDLCGALLDELAGLTIPRLVVPPSPPDVDVVPLTGTYRNILSVVRVEADRNGLRAFPRYASAIAAFQPRRTRLVPVTRTVFAGHDHAHRDPRAWTFYRLPDGTPHVLVGGSSIPKVG
ncbi:beta-lactamase family protein [Streptomyces sp. UNOC14_S4]|nr:serine hydrolase domain-containing protein [Streptomyces sp. UNOC14_S4]MCC3767643.1 beta-lactamase family protein [Streptomyces sp. UNOC14_S4]